MGEKKKDIPNIMQILAFPPYQNLQNKYSGHFTPKPNVMKMMKKKACVLFSMLISTCFILSATYAQEQQPAQEMTSPTDPQTEMQEEFSDEEIKTFIDVNEKVVEVQKEGEQKMMEAIEGEDIAIDRFNEILMSRQDPSQETDASPEELAAFSKAAEKVMEVQKDLEAKAIKTIEDEGMEMERYQQIMLAYQQNPKVQQQVQKLMGEEGSGDQ